MQKLVRFVLLLIFFGLLAYYASGHILYWPTRIAFSILENRSPDFGVKLDNTSFHNVRFSKTQGLMLEDVFMSVQPTGKDSSQIFDLHLDSVSIKSSNFKDRQFLLLAKGITAVFHPPAGTSTDLGSEHRIIGKDLKIAFQLELSKPKKVYAQFKSIGKGLMALLQSGRTRIPIQFEGFCNFSFKGKSLRVRMDIVLEKGESVFVINQDDIRNVIAPAFEEGLTNAEIEIISQFPIRAPQLLQIRNYVKSVENRLREEDPKQPWDGYKHVLWGYVLAKRYDADFSKRVTDAHEMKSQGPNPDGELRMDMANNALGRKYALAKYEEKDLFKLAFNDPDFVKNAAFTTPQTAAEETADIYRRFKIVN